MNEETNVELMEDDNFFDPADFMEDNADGDHTAGMEPMEEQQSEETLSDPIETTTKDPKPEEPAEQSPANQQELFELNYMGNVEKHTREEMIALAQKGKDRDRILQQRDNLQQFRTQNEPVLGDLARVSNLFGLEPATFLSTMERNLHRQQGKTDAEAEALVRAEEAERRLNATLSKQREAKQEREATMRRQQADIDEFIRRYPSLDPKTIPQSVWEEVRNGGTLVNAYGRYETEQLKAENQRLQQQLATQKQNEKNKENSLGSMKSGQGQKPDPFLDGFMSG